MQTRQPADKINDTVLDANVTTAGLETDLAGKSGQTSELRAYRWRARTS